MQRLPEAVRKQWTQNLQKRNKDNQRAYEARQMTPEQRSRRAQDLMTKQHIDHAAKQGREMTETEARAKVSSIAQVAEQRRVLGEVK